MRAINVKLLLPPRGAVWPKAAPALEHEAEAVKLRGGFCAGRFGLRGRPASGCRPRANAARSADRCRGVCGGSGRAWAARGMEIELVRDIRVHIAATAPKEFASVIMLEAQPTSACR